MTTVPEVTPELPSAKWRTIISILQNVPHGGLSRSFGRISDVPVPRRLRKRVIGLFASTLGINVAEAEKPLTEYATMNEFFVRRLKSGLRNWPSDAETAGSPVDGIVGQLGRIAAGRIIQAKGRMYDVAALLDDADEAKRFTAGCFVTIYLSPRHYHRMHTPTAGEIPKARHVPGALLPVNEAAVLHVDNLFPRNERLITYVDGPLGRIAVVAVGAYNVGRISAAYDTSWSGIDGVGWVTNRKGVTAETKTYAPAIPVKTGDEIMAFHLGSTVVVLFESERCDLFSALEPGLEIKLGEPIVRVT